MPSNVSLPNAFVRLRGFNPRLGQWQEITSMGLPLGQTTGNLSVACGVLEFGGQYSLTMLMQTTGPVLAETTFYSLWPNLVLHLPSSHLALTANVVMEIRSSATCGSRLHREFLSLVLTYQRTKGTEGTATRLSQPVVLEMTNFTPSTRTVRSGSSSVRLSIWRFVPGLPADLLWSRDLHI
ncbi:hypothetical protein C0Q70_05456 [Pomacea canaliculata]|uniref:Uncharacterized protein n=4 Tax=Pomacea canaliculata TaxID=400727 RepID=A0A2T7PLA2_POMCA|nr:hypothetical protein C0Q70_05456 [Pomacea canaliculata]